jgi:hypothetical protein
MQIHIGSKHLTADVAVALDVTGREHLVIVAKATWRIPDIGQRPRPMQPEPLAVADTFYGEPGVSAMRYGSDFCRFKPQCDVLFDACAHSPAGQPVRELVAGWQVGPLKKSLRVRGPRRWHRLMGVNVLGESEPFVSAPLHYGLAFGGTRHYTVGTGNKAQELAEAYLPNPVGQGFAGRRTIDQLDKSPAPQLEALKDPVRSPGGKHKAVAFSAVPSHCSPRKEHAGTYDDAWQQNLAPFLPEDFDERFHQCAPLDQQMRYPKGGEEVALHNLLPGRERLRFHLPLLDRITTRVLRTDYSTDTLQSVVDTLWFETEAQRFSAVWRTSVPLRRRVQEIDTIAIGPVNPDWWRARSLGLEKNGGCDGCGTPEALFGEPA